MRAFIAFLKKEILEGIRNGKFMLLGILFFAFGIMNPAIAKLTPWLMDIMSEELMQSGMIVTEVSVDALTSWTQFFKNIPMALIVLVLVYGGCFVKEYESGSLVLMLTKGLSRSKVVLAKSFVMLFVWSAGYLLCFGVTYAYNVYFWDNSIANELVFAVAYWWLFGIFVISLTVLFSVLLKGYGGVLLGTGTAVLASYLVGLLPKLTKYMPSYLMNSGVIVYGVQKAEDYFVAAIITAAVSVLCILVSIPVFNKKQI